MNIYRYLFLPAVYRARHHRRDGILPLHVVEDKLTNILAAVAIRSIERAQNSAVSTLGMVRELPSCRSSVDEQYLRTPDRLFIFTINTYRFVNVHPRERVQPSCSIWMV